MLCVAATIPGCEDDEPSATSGSTTDAGGASTSGAGEEDGGTGGDVWPAGPGDLDPDFGDGGVVEVPGAEIVHDLGMDSQGRVILVYERGEDRAIPSPENPAETLTWREPHYTLVRLTAQGALDTSFGAGGSVELSTSSPLECHIGDCQAVSSTLIAEWALTVTPEDEMLLAARYGLTAAPEGPYYYSPNSPAVQSTVMRVTSSGARDLGFGNGGEVQCLRGQATYAWQAQSNGGWDVGHCQGGVRPLVLGDGRILIAHANDLMVLSRDGAPDSSFAPLNILHQAGELGGAEKGTTLCQHLTGPDYFNSEYHPARILYYSEQPEGIFVAMNCEQSYGDNDGAVDRRYSLFVDLTGQPLYEYSSPIQALHPDQFSNAIDGDFYCVRYTISQWGAFDSFRDIYGPTPSGGAQIWLDARLTSDLAAGRPPVIRLTADHKLLVLDDERLVRLTLGDDAQATLDATFGDAGVTTFPPGFTQVWPSPSGITHDESGVIIVVGSDGGGVHLLRYAL